MSSSSHHNKHNGKKPALMDHKKLLASYEKAEKRMFFMDYDGTLAPIVDKPEDAAPSDELKETLKNLVADNKNHIYVVSGRDRKTLSKWLGDIRIGMSAEHGCFLRLLSSDSPDGKSSEWTDLVREKGIDASWKETVKEVCDKYAHKLKGATVECKEYAITFHYRQCVKGSTKPIVTELKRELDELSYKYSSLNILKGKKSYEARIKGITKGTIVSHILDVSKREGVDFVFSGGDDLTDEDMFTELQSDSHLKGGVFTCTVNFPDSKALTYVEDQKQMLNLLRELVTQSGKSS